MAVRSLHIEPECEQCGDPVPAFQNTMFGKWLGNPVLYMGKDSRNIYAAKYQFCDADCLFDWLKDVLGNP